MVLLICAAYAYQALAWIMWVWFFAVISILLYTFVLIDGVIRCLLTLFCSEAALEDRILVSWGLWAVRLSGVFIGLILYSVVLYLNLSALYWLLPFFLDYPLAREAFLWVHYLVYFLFLN